MVKPHIGEGLPGTQGKSRELVKQITSSLVWSLLYSCTPSCRYKHIGGGAQGCTKPYSLALTPAAPSAPSGPVPTGKTAFYLSCFS